MTAREIGAAAELVAVDYLKCLPGSRAVRLVSDVTAYGYDIEVIEDTSTGKKLFAYEVKAWNENGYFFVTAHEVEVLRQLGDSGRILLVDINKKKVVKVLENPFKDETDLKPLTFKFFY